jgi:hypothetical protein
MEKFRNLLFGQKRNMDKGVEETRPIKIRQLICTGTIRKVLTGHLRNGQVPTHNRRKSAKVFQGLSGAESLKKKTPEFPACLGPV